MLSFVLFIFCQRLFWNKSWNPNRVLVGVWLPYCGSLFDFVFVIVDYLIKLPKTLPHFRPEHYFAMCFYTAGISLPSESLVLAPQTAESWNVWCVCSMVTSKVRFWFMFLFLSVIFGFVVYFHCKFHSLVVVMLFSVVCFWEPGLPPSPLCFPFIPSMQPERWFWLLFISLFSHFMVCHQMFECLCLYIFLIIYFQFDGVDDLINIS